jgi:hypothetical protein
MAAPTEGVLMVEGATAVGRTPAGTAGVMAKGQATEEAILKEAMAEAYLAIHIHLKVHKCVVVEK